MKYVIELEPGTFLATWVDDPGRTKVLENAKLFRRERTARLALARIQNKPLGKPVFPEGKVIEVEIIRKDSNEKA